MVSTVLSRWRSHGVSVYVNNSNMRTPETAACRSIPKVLLVPVNWQDTRKFH